MNALALSSAKVSTDDPALVALIGMMQSVVGSVPQVDVETEHVLHAGIYARTVRLTAGVVGTGVLIKIPTLLIVRGDADLLTDAGWIQVRGYTVLSGQAGRKPMFVTRTQVEMTMLFATQALTVDEAEREFTDECDELLSRKDQPCQV